MDIARPGRAREKKIKRIIYGGSGLAVVLLITLGLSTLEPAAPSVDRATVWIDSVKRGSMLRQVRGLGTLEPEEIRWIPARTQGRVERRLILPGARVEPTSVILELSNPQLEVDLRDAESQMRAARARYTELRVQLESQRLEQAANAARVKAEYEQARLRADRDAQLFAEGLVADIDRQLSRVTAEELENRHGIEQQRFAIAAESIEAQLAVQSAAVDQAGARMRLVQEQFDDLQVKAGIHGVLQELPVEVGQQVLPGANLARVAQPDRLKAVVRIAETQAKDLEIGLVARVDTRNGVIEAHVARIHPAAQNGTVTVDLALDSELPKGTRPDLTVDGTVELERLEDVLYVGRPAQGQSDSLVGLFRLDPDSDDARRAQVRLGRSSVNTVEIVEGLQEGDQVILSDTSAWDAFDRIRLN